MNNNKIKANDMIASEDIDVLIQGRTNKEYTDRCIASVRKFLPKARILISTWVGEYLDEKNVDEILYSEDPGGYPDPRLEGYTNNALRIVKSTKAGLGLLRREWTLKIRSDIIFKSVNFINYIDKFPTRDKDYSFLEKRVIVSSQFTKEYIYWNGRVQPTPFHVSDWLEFGLTEDIKRLNSISEPEEPMESLYYLFNEKDQFKEDLLRASHRYAPEQFVFFNACKKYFPNVNFNNYLDYNIKNIAASAKIILNNLIVLDPWMIAYEHIGKYRQWNRKERNLPKDLKTGLYTHEKFLMDYKRHLCNSQNN